MEILMHEYGITTCDTDWYIADEIQNFSRVYYVRAGDVTYIDEFSTMKLKRYHLYILPTDRKYSISHTRFNRFKTMYFHITTSTPITKIMEYNMEGNNMTLIDLMDDEIEGNNNIEIVKSLFNALIVNCMESQSSNYTRDISNVIEYIKANIGSAEHDFSVETLSKMAGLDKYYFIRKFKKQTDFTPTQYIINERLDKVVANFGGNTLKSLSLEYGFKDYKNFSTLFKNRFGVAPKVYEQIMSAKV